jgi:hypothetical protein
MIEHSFDSMSEIRQFRGRPRECFQPFGSCPEMTPKSPCSARNKTPTSGVYRRMKRVNPSLVVATLRIAFAVAIALVLILVLLPAMLAAQAVGLR